MRLVSDDAYTKMVYFIEFLRLPDLKIPKTFNENICKRKIDDKMLENSVYTDKFAVKEYVKDKIGEDHLIKMINVYDSADEIEFDTLPNQFAIKCTHSSGQNIIVKDKSQLVANKAKRKLKKWLKINYYWIGREKNYKKIVPRILIEEYVDLSSYNEIKTFCFFGKVKFMTVNVIIDGKRYTNVYDRDFNRINVLNGYKSCGFSIECIENRAQVVELAEILSEVFDFVRVDMYTNGKNILFSELTFNPGGGIVSFSPEKFDEEFGQYFVR